MFKKTFKSQYFSGIWIGLCLLMFLLIANVFLSVLEMFYRIQQIIIQLIILRKWTSPRNSASGFLTFMTCYQINSKYSKRAFSTSKFRLPHILTFFNADRHRNFNFDVDSTSKFWLARCDCPFLLINCLVDQITADIL